MMIFKRHLTEPVSKYPAYNLEVIRTLLLLIASLVVSTTV